MNTDSTSQANGATDPTSIVQRVLHRQTQYQATKLGYAVSSFSDAVRDIGIEVQKRQPAMPVNRIATNVTSVLDRAADYLASTDGAQIFADVESFGRERPALAASAALVVGFVGARLIKVSSIRTDAA